ncbi:MAG: hypothetical protein HC833_01890 [Leptolyngbyaceae cyanobacterium RM1_406_9]|nr:hypothetical protein [Leptolyngbyaceae cyanobacterium RM1_406_9]
MSRQPIKNQFYRSMRSLSLKKSWTLWEGWVAVMAIAELIGLGIVVIAATLIHSLGTESSVTVLHLVGLLEGIILGVAQWLVLHRYIKRINAWVIVTAIAVMIVWLIGIKISALMVFSITLDTTLTPAMQAKALLKGVALLGAWVGGVLGFAQWFVLKSHIHRAAMWIVANALAWALGLAVAFTMVNRIHSARFNLETALAGIATGLTTGAVVGAITGITLIWLLRPRLLRRDQNPQEIDHDESL